MAGLALDFSITVSTLNVEKICFALFFLHIHLEIPEGGTFEKVCSII